MMFHTTAVRYASTTAGGLSIVPKISPGHSLFKRIERGTIIQLQYKKPYTAYLRYKAA